MQLVEVYCRWQEEKNMTDWTKELTVSFNRMEGEEEIEYEADVKVTVCHDVNYGADADGNRGVPMTFIDEVNVKELRIIKGNKVIRIIKENDITDELNELISDKVDDADLSPDEPDCDDQSDEE